MFPNEDRAESKLTRGFQSGRPWSAAKTWKERQRERKKERDRERKKKGGNKEDKLRGEGKP